MPSPTSTDNEQRTPSSGSPAHHVPAHLYWLTRLVQMPLMALATAFFGTISLLCGLWDRSGRQQHLVARAWAGVMLRFALSPVELIGLENVPGKQSPGAPFMERSDMSGKEELAGAPFVSGRKDAHGWDENVPAVYASNHLSYMDTPVLF